MEFKYKLNGECDDKVAEEKIIDVDEYINMGLITPTELVLQCNQCKEITYANMEVENEDINTKKSLSDFLLLIRNVSNGVCKCPHCNNSGSEAWSIVGVSNSKQEQKILDEYAKEIKESEEIKKSLEKQTKSSSDVNISSHDLVKELMKIKNVSFIELDEENAYIVTTKSKIAIDRNSYIFTVKK